MNEIPISIIITITLIIIAYMIFAGYLIKLLLKVALEIWKN